MENAVKDRLLDKIDRFKQQSALELVVASEHTVEQLCSWRFYHGIEPSYIDWCTEFVVRNDLVSHTFVSSVAVNN